MTQWMVREWEDRKAAMTPTDAQRLRLQFERNHWRVTHRVNGQEISREDYHLIVAALTAAAEVVSKSGYKYVSTYDEIVAHTIERCAQVLETAYTECGTLNLLHGAARLRALKDTP